MVQCEYNNFIFPHLWPALARLLSRRFLWNFKREFNSFWSRRDELNANKSKKKSKGDAGINKKNVKDNFCLTFTVSGHLEPEFVDAVQNITVPIGRDVKFSCHVRHLGTSYKVSFSFFFYFPFIFLILLLYFYFQLAILFQHRLLYSLKLNISPYVPSIKWLTF